MNSRTQARSKLSLLLIISAFIVPIVVAKIALEQQWFNYGSTNQGKLVQSPLTLASLQLDFSPADKRALANKWLIVFSQPQPCLQYCQQVVKSLENTYQALGRYMPRVAPVFIKNKVNNSAQSSLFDFSNIWRFTEASTASKQHFTEPTVVVVDPLGNLVLTHQVPPQSTANSLQLFGKGLLADLKKLLKYSRVG